jgi:hypothetical protein
MKHPWYVQQHNPEEPMKTQLQKLTQKALAQARKMGREAAKEDGWMEPLPEEHDETDYGEFTDAHREGWEQTNHFWHYYGQPLYDLAHEEAEKKGVTPQTTREYGVAVHESFYCPLKDEFWEVWEEKVKLYEKWDKAHAAAAR